MERLNKNDLKLIEKAKEIIKKNYDNKEFNHTVGSALLSKKGNIYLGVNVYSLHGACAEIIALGSAIANGEREFVSVVAVRGGEKEEIIPPCGNCRQVLLTYAQDIDVIINDDYKIKINELLPYSYEVKN